MYGFGDASTPLSDSRNLVKTIVEEYMVNTVRCSCARASARARLRGIAPFAAFQTLLAMRASKISGKLDHEAFIYVHRDDPLKTSRARQLLALKHEIMKVRQEDLTDLEKAEDR